MSNPTFISFYTDSSYYRDCSINLQKQIESFVEYYTPIARKYNLSLKDIITHQMIAPGRKPDITNKEYNRILSYMKSKNFK
jgi:hypothetical protein